VCREAAKKKAAATTKKAAAATTKKAAAKTTKAAGATAVKDGDVICLRSHNGNYINAEPGNDIVSARCGIKADRSSVTIETQDGGAVGHGDRVWLRGFQGGYIDIQGDMVRMKFASRERCDGVTIAKDGAGDVCYGDVVYFSGGDRNTFIDVENQDVRARWPDMGSWQVMTVEPAD